MAGLQSAGASESIDESALADFKRGVSGTLVELFSSGDIGEAISSIDELKCPQYAHDIVKRAISLSLDRTETERELISKFFLAAHQSTTLPTTTLLSTATAAEGFKRVLQSVEELQIDAPGAPATVASFLARALVDGILPKSFLADPSVVEVGGDVVSLTNRKLEELGRSPVLAAKIWGPGDGRPVDELKLAVDALLLRYLKTGNLSEAENALRDMRVPYFHHEVVKRSVSLCAQAAKPEEQRVKIAVLFRHLRGVSLAITDEVLSEEQLQSGMIKAQAALLKEGQQQQQQQQQGDVSAAAAAVLEYLATEAVEQGLVRPEFKPTSDWSSPDTGYSRAASRLGFEHPDYIPTSEPTSPFFRPAAADMAAIEELAI